MQDPVGAWLTRLCQYRGVGTPDAYQSHLPESFSRRHRPRVEPGMPLAAGVSRGYWAGAPIGKLGSPMGSWPFRSDLIDCTAWPRGRLA